MFGSVVAEHRRRLSLSQEELAARTGLSARAIRRLEAGEVRAPRPSSIRLLADAFGLEDEQRNAFILAAGGGGPEPSTVGASESRAVHGLPRPASHFTGRDVEMARVLLTVDRRPELRPLVVAVDGMAGVGKTALALEIAYRVAAIYPDGQLFVDLRGHSEDAPVEPAVALGVLLDQLGVPADDVPETLEGRVARWRTELAGRRVLVVLDNAAGSEQVASLVPGMAPVLVLVTSRRRLVGLDADEHVTLDPLDVDTAVALLVGVIGQRRVCGHVADVRAVAELCGNLPLALRLTAARLRHRPTWTVSDLVERLRASRPPVVEMGAEGTSVAAALMLSYRQLSEPAGRLLRRLGLQRADDFDAYAAAALDDTTAVEVRPAIDELLDAHLVQEPDPDRYHLHDLVHDHASRLASEIDDEHTRRASVQRLLEYYLHSLVSGLPDGTAIDGLHVPDWGPPSPHGRAFSTEAERARWEHVEWRNVIAAVNLAESLGMDRPLYLLTRAIWGFHYRRGDAQLLTRLSETALVAAQRLGDADLTAIAHNYLAGAHARGGQIAQARHHLTRARTLWRTAGDATAELSAIVNLMTMELMTGRFREAIAHGRSVADEPTDDRGAPELLRRRIAINMAAALRIVGECYLSLGEYCLGLVYLRQAARGHDSLVGRESPRWAIVLYSLGQVHARLAHRVTAPLLLRRALAVFEQVGDESGAAMCLAELGIIHLRAGDLCQARRLHEGAVERTGRAGVPHAHCQTLNRLGTTLLCQGDAVAAVARHREALTIAQRIESRYEEAVAHTGLAEALSTLDPVAADRHARAGSRLFTAMGAVDPYHVADDPKDRPLTS